MWIWLCGWLWIIHFFFFKRRLMAVLLPQLLASPSLQLLAALRLLLLLLGFCSLGASWTISMDRKCSTSPFSSLEGAASSPPLTTISITASFAHSTADQRPGPPPELRPSSSLLGVGHQQHRPHCCQLARFVCSQSASRRIWRGPSAPVWAGQSAWKCKAWLLWLTSVYFISFYLLFWI